jgi:predicted ATPase/DNA-binding XRE family transcriptional regulator
VAHQHAPFGEQLRQLREAAGLTQEGLAEAAGLSVSAIAVLERGERRKPYPNTVRALVDALRLSGEARTALLASVPARSATALPAATPVTALPRPLASSLDVPRTSLVGRESDLARVGRLLQAGARLVTLTGPGGVGKTRLAVQLANDTRDRFADGVAFVDLSPLSDPRLFLPSIARALGFRETSEQLVRDAVREHLQPRRLLLVLDNFEHVVAAAREAVDLLSACPGVVMLVTSRSPLRLRGEQEYPVPPLAVPDLGQVPTPEEATSVPAVRLFLERAREVSPAFELNRANAAVVAAICRRLEGLPLAIELAAARVRLLSPTTLLARLDQSLPLLTGGARDLPERQQTMRAAIGWSYQLLTEPQRHLFNRLAVFRGGWDLEASEALGTGDAQGEDVLDLLERLVEQSLVVAEPGVEQERRYRMLVPIREYAEEQLALSDEDATVRRTHAAWYLSLAQRAEREMWGERHGRWPARLEAEYDNLRAALGWAVAAGEIEIGLRLTYALWKFTRSQGRVTEMRGWQERLLSGSPALSADLRAQALWVAGDLAGLAGDYDGAVGLLEMSLATAQGIGDDVGAAKALYLLGNVAEDLGDAERQTALYEEALNRFQAIGDAWWTAEVTAGLGRAKRKRGDYASARQLHQDALAHQQAAHNRWGAAWGLTALAELAADEGQLERAATLFAESLKLHADHSEQMGMLFCLLGLGKLACAVGAWEAAATVLGATEALREARGLTLPQDHRESHDTCVAELRAGLGASPFIARWDQGRSLLPDQAAAFGIDIAQTVASES